MAEAGRFATQGGDGAARARELLAAAHELETTDPHRSRVLVQQARAVARTAGDRSAEAEALYRLASLSYYAGQADEAFGLGIDARNLALEADDAGVLASALHLLALVHSSAGNYTEALSCCLEALDRYRSTDRRVDEGIILNTLATIHHELGDTDRAIVNYEAALAANRRLDRPDLDALTLANVAKLRTERREHLLAVGLGEEALQLCRDHAPAFLPEVLVVVADAYAGMNDHRRATELLCEALDLADSADDEVAPAARVKVQLGLGKVARDAGDLPTALSHLEQALELARKGGLKLAELEAETALSEAYKRAGDFERALVHHEARFELNQQLFNEGTDLRIKTLQIAHETEEARQQAEILRLRTTELEALVRGRTAELEAFQLEALQRLAVLGEFRDTDTGEHTVRVGDLSAELAHVLGADPDWAERLRLAARLHDIGKVAIPDSILLKPGPLTPAEFEVMKTHTTIGARILAGSNSPLMQLAEEVALNHHERWDGAGYPHGRSGEDVPLSGRIVTVADVFDALTSERSYKRAWSVEDAVRYISRASGTQFDARVVDAFLQVMLARHPELTPIVAHQQAVA
jgi:putative two-component system response regulator